MFGRTKTESEGTTLHRAPTFMSLLWSGMEIDANVSLEPLIRQVRHYDELRLKLEKQGGQIADLEKISNTLSKVITLKGRFGNVEAALTDPRSVRQMLFEVGGFDLHMEVRRLQTEMPVYYFCRIRRDFWSEYTLIVEDLYRSPEYPVLDDRFVKLMSGGHEAYHLRLSQFRGGVTGLIKKEEEEEVSSSQIDEMLYNLGRNVFQAAWHEDQRPAVLAATHFELPKFRNAVELLYICLSGELCELRSVVDERLLSFFVTIYPQPAMHAFLSLLTRLDGGSINEMPQKAAKLYSKLSKAFGRFLRTEIPWGSRKVRMPVYKLIFGNFTRLDLVAADARQNETLQKTAGQLEEESQLVVDGIVNG